MIKDKIYEILKTVKYPGYSRDLVSFGMVREIKVENSVAYIKLFITSLREETIKQIEEEIVEKVSKLEGIKEVRVELERASRQTTPPKTKGTEEIKKGPFADQQKIPGVKCVIAVASGKGGVGKTTVAVNLALALSKLGYKVGLMDADVYGPNVPTMLGIEGARPRLNTDEKLLPIEAEGLKVISVGFFVEKDQPVIWRGPLVTKLIEQFLRDVVWSPLDVLVVDLPPGTGDTQLTLVQKVPVNGGIVVTTPQELALQDARKGIRMFEEVGVPVIGIVENMSYLTCPYCGQKIQMFPKAGTDKAAKRFGVPLLEELPFDPAAAFGSDEGKPIVLSQPDSSLAKAFSDLAKKVVESVSCIEPVQ